MQTDGDGFKGVEMTLWTKKVCRKCGAINPGDTVVCIKPGCSCREFKKEVKDADKD